LRRARNGSKLQSPLAAHTQHIVFQREEKDGVENRLQALLPQLFPLARVATSVRSIRSQSLNAKGVRMRLKKLVVACTGAFVIGAGSAALLPGPLAHPVFDPYDNTQFAPITNFGPLITLKTVAKGLVSPLKGVTAPGDPNGLYIVDQPGRIFRIDLTVAPPVDVSGLKPFLDVSSELVTLGVLGPDTFDERGLLGLAFHPNFQSNGKFYTYMSVPAKGMPTLPSTLPAGTAPDHQNVVAEWTKKGNRISGPRILMRVDWPQFNHDGGDLAFGPDGMLYISMGDGGGADDRDGQDFLGTPMVGHGNCGNAQNLGNPLGKILRIDVDGHSPGKSYGIPSGNPFVSTPGAVQEIYAHGLRNPYRFSFDATTGVLYVGDVGQNDIEEVNVVVSGGNYGWNFKEGTLFFDTNGNADGFATETPSPTPGCSVPAGVIDPIAQYDNHHEGHSVIAGFAYRGTQLPNLVGRFIFGDYSRLFKFPGGPHDYGRLFHITPGAASGLLPVHEFHITPSNAPNIAVLGFGQDATREVYVMGNVLGIPFGSGGVVMRLAPAPD
jgi:glucose/arabinose dehydrogenase